MNINSFFIKYKLYIIVGALGFAGLYSINVVPSTWLIPVIDQPISWAVLAACALAIYVAYTYDVVLVPEQQQPGRPQQRQPGVAPPEEVLNPVPATPIQQRKTMFDDFDLKKK